MNDDFEALQREWQKDKDNIKSDTTTMNDLFFLIQKKKKASVRFQFGNIIVLLITMLGITAFFYYVAPVKETLSRIGAGLMVIGLFLRIVIEMISIIKSKNIDVKDNVLETSEKTITYYKFRKTIHGPITIIILVLYTIGFYMITPEFSLYFSTWKMILIDVSYLVAACIFIPIIRKSIKREIRTLLDIIDLKNRIINNEQS
ncbi:hypothetical protein [Aquimarina sp. AU474]|uniref:hypothetical protein n=1 Tax=Aquimarina sp. AU474 TaxID=2108529 RepID=UPI000D69735D|nr:hypothetical protein [Aquimarina sp. AU474]